MERQREDTGRLVQIPAGPITLDGDLDVPAGAAGIVVLAHGSGRRSPRNRMVAQTFRAAGLATLLIDLLTPIEAAIEVRTRRLRFNVAVLARRLTGATDWLQLHPITCQLRVGYFGANTTAAAALLAAAERPDVVGAIVSRGGRPDLAGEVLPRLRAPTLLIVGADDFPVARMNREALAYLGGVRHLEVISGATHRFEQPGALEQVAQLACSWFTRYLLVAEERDALQPPADLEAMAAR